MKNLAIKTTSQTKPLSRITSATYIGSVEYLNPKELTFTVIGVSDDDVSETQDDFLRSSLYEVHDFDLEDEIWNYKVVFSDKLKKKIEKDLLKHFNSANLLYKEIKKDGQFFRAIDEFLINLFFELRGKRNDDFKDGKIPNNEIEFLKCIADAVNHRLSVISENYGKKS